MSILSKSKFPINGTAKEIGNYYENYTKERLQKEGFGFLAHSYLAHPHEIDLIMTEDSYIVFVEVKARLTSERIKPEFAVDKVKMKNIFFAAARFIAEMSDMGIDPHAFGYRFDMAAIEHEENGQVSAFRYHRSYYEVEEKDLIRYAQRYKSLSINKIKD